MEILVQVDWDNDGSFATSGDDISDWVIDVATRIGIDSLDTRVAYVGTASITLSNEDQRFSPAYASGMYYGKFRPGLPVRVQVVEDAITRTVFVGVVRAFAADSGPYGPQRAVIQAADLLAQLQDYQLALPLQRNQTPGHLLKLITAAAFKGEVAEGVVWFAGQPSAGDTITIDNQTYTLRASVSSTPNEVLIGAGLEETIANLYAAVNGLEGAGTTYGTNTARPARAVAQLTNGYYHRTMRTNPVWYFRLGEPSGTTAANRGANSKAGTYVGTPTLGATGALYGAGFGDSNTAVTFDGVDDCVRLDSIEIARQSFTVMCYVKPSASPPAQQDVFGFRTADSTRKNLTLRVFSDGSLGLYFYGDDAFSGAGKVAFGSNWYHLAVTYEHASDTAKVYVNGVEAISGTIGPFEGASPAVRIGCNGAETDFFKGGIDEWTLHFRALSAAEISDLYTNKGDYFGLRVRANARGAWGNAVPIDEVGTNINVTDTVLSGGTDAPGTLDFDDGPATLDIAGDLWKADSTNALTAIQDVIQSAWGLFWVTRAGVPTFRDRDFTFEQCAATPAATFDSDQNEAEAMADFSTLRNHVVVSWIPREEMASGVLAKSDGIVSVQGRGLEASESDRLGGSTATDNERPPGKRSVRLSATDPDTGLPIGIESLVLPLVAGTDFEINDAEDFTGFNYTNNGHVKFAVAVDGSSVEIGLENTALGTLYIRGLQVRGVGWKAKSPQQVVREDAASQAAYGRRTHVIDLPLGGNHEALAESLAAYMLGRYANPVYEVRALSLENEDMVGTDSLWDVEIGDVVAVNDEWLGITGHKYLVLGMAYRLDNASSKTESQIDLTLARLDDTTYGVLDDATYGVLDSTARLAL